MSEEEERLPFKCVGCGKELWAHRSIMMHMGRNSGHGSCTQCKTFMHLKVSECGTKMEAMDWDEYMMNHHSDGKPVGILNE